MSKKSIDPLKQINTLILAESETISEEVIQYYEEHPQELELIIDRELFNVAYLRIIFILGIVITASAKMIEYFWGKVL